MLHQPDLFLQERMPKKPYCTDDLQLGIRPRSYKTAITHRYVQVNPPHLRHFLLFDLDYSGAAIAWEDANLPMPAWAAMNRDNGHAHLAYALKTPVLTADFKGRLEPLRYLATIEACFRAALRGDDGFSGLITKNPIPPHWVLLKGVPDAIRGYSLKELESCIDAIDFAKCKPYAHKYQKRTDMAGLGRNCTVFADVSRWAYRAILPLKREGITRIAWENEVLAQCQNVNADFRETLSYNELRCIARSIAKWVYAHFNEQAKSAWHTAQNQKRKTYGAGSGRKPVSGKIILLGDIKND